MSVLPFRYDFVQLPKIELKGSKAAVRPNIFKNIVDHVHDLEIDEIGKRHMLTPETTNNCMSPRGIGFLNVHWFVVIDCRKVVA